MEEFTRRETIVREAEAIEKAESEAQKNAMTVPENNAKTRSIPRGAMIGKTTYLNSDFELTDGEEELKQNGQVVALKMKPYDAALHKNTVIFKKTPVEELFFHITDLISAA